MTKISIAVLMRVSKPVPEGQDSNCPKIIFQSHSRNPFGDGEWVCSIQSMNSSFAGLSIGKEEYMPCNCSDYHKCSAYQDYYKKRFC